MQNMHVQCRVTRFYISYTSDILHFWFINVLILYLIWVELIIPPSYTVGLLNL